MKHLLSNISILILLCLFISYKSNSQIYKFRVLLTRTANVKAGSIHPAKVKVDTTNFIISYDLDNDKIIIHKGDYELNYDGFNAVLDSPYSKQLTMKAIDDNGIQCNIFLEIGKSDEGYDGQLQIIYLTKVTIYYFKIL